MAAGETPSRADAPLESIGEPLLLLSATIVRNDCDVEGRGNRPAGRKRVPATIRSLLRRKSAVAAVDVDVSYAIQARGFA